MSREIPEEYISASGWTCSSTTAKPSPPRRTDCLGRGAFFYPYSPLDHVHPG